MDRRRPKKRSAMVAPQRRYRMEDQVIEPKDDSRPFFQRKKGEIGIYLDAYDAKPVKPHDWGSHHFFMVNVMDKLYEYLQSVHLFAIKGGLERKNVLRHVILERFEKGIVLAVSFDNVEALEMTWKLHNDDKLSSAFQDIVVTKTTLDLCQAKVISLRAKLWEDEYTPCKRETASRPNSVVSIESQEKDMKMLKHVRDFQRTRMREIVSEMRDDEAAIESGLGEFVLAVKTALPTFVTTIPTLKDFLGHVRVARTKKDANVMLLDRFTAIVERQRAIFDEVQRNIAHPLSQVHAYCEKDKQRRLKEQIRLSCIDMRQKLRLDNNLRTVKHADWKAKILPREEDLFLGAISLVPMGLEKLVDIDHNVDEYIAEYPINIQ